MKIVSCQKRRDKAVILDYGIFDYPPDLLEGIDAQKLGIFVRECLKKISVPVKKFDLSMSGRSAMVKFVEFPQMSVMEIKQAIKLNSAAYLHQNYSDYRLDCHIIRISPPPPGSKPDMKQPTKFQVLVGGALESDVKFFRDAVLEAGYEVDSMSIAPVALINAFEVNHQAIFRQEVIALVEVGFTSTFILVLDHGHPVFMRSFKFGGMELTNFIANTLTMDVASAEEEKRQMSETVQMIIAQGLSTLSREIRASIDFFERQSDLVVSQIYLSGGTAQSTFIQKQLGDDLGAKCVAWNPCQSLVLNLPSAKIEILRKSGPVLGVAVGTAVGQMLIGEE